MAADVLVRRLGEPTDAERLGEFLVGLARDTESARFFHPHPLTREFADGLCASLARIADRYYVAETDDQIAGYAMLRGWDEGYDIPSFGVAVHPELRGRGVGRTLLLHAVEEARGSGAKRLRLTVDPDNHRAVDIYRSFGFRFEAQSGRRDLLGFLDLTT